MVVTEERGKRRWAKRILIFAAFYVSAHFCAIVFAGLAPHEAEALTASLFYVTGFAALAASVLFGLDATQAQILPQLVPKQPKG